MLHILRLLCSLSHASCFAQSLARCRYFVYLRHVVVILYSLRDFLAILQSLTRCHYFVQSQPCVDIRYSLSLHSLIHAVAIVYSLRQVVVILWSLRHDMTILNSLRHAVPIWIVFDTSWLFCMVSSTLRLFWYNLRYVLTILFSPLQVIAICMVFGLVCRLEQSGSNKGPAKCPAVKKAIPSSLATILITVHRTKPIFRHEQKFDEGSPYMKFGRNCMTNHQTRHLADISVATLVIRQSSYWNFGKSLIKVIHI